jgi:hypothetical protein
VILTHGNGPQVGHILLRVEAARHRAYQSQRGGPRGVSPWVNALPAGSGGLLAT